MLAELEGLYGLGNDAVAADDGALSDAERAWGLAPPRDYADILARTYERDFVPRFAARDIAVRAPRPATAPAPGAPAPTSTS